MKKIVSLVYKGFEEIEMLNDRAKQYAAAKGLEYEWVRLNPYDQERAIRALAAADAGIIDCEPYDGDVFSKICERNKLLIRYGVGFDAVNLADATRYGVKIARTQGANATAVAEMALTMMMTLKRKILAVNLGAAEWASSIGTELSGCTVGILGFGAVGRRLAKILAGFDCKILAFDVYQDAAAAEELHVEYRDLGAIFSEADVVSCHMALNAETARVINRDMLKRMKRNAIIVNTARGGLVNDEDLQNALKSGELAGAGLDVFTTEPLPSDSAYRGMRNLVMTPHIASATLESFWNMYRDAIDIAGNVLLGEGDSRILN